MITPLTPQMLSKRAVLRLSGDNVLAFLHNILTCELVSLPPQQWAYGALLSPQGKIQHDMFVGHEGATVFIDCAASQADGLLQKLKLYRLRAKIDIAQDDTVNVAVSADAIAGLLTAHDPRFATMGYRSIVMAPQHTHDGNYEAQRIALGMPDSEADIGVNHLFPHEANFDLIGGVSFSKGCYVGQEVVSRMQHRGTARSRILPIFGSAALTTGAALVAEETTIGTVLSASGNFALALIRIDRWHTATVPITAGGIAVNLRAVDWLPPSIMEHHA